jgi:uncharacterized protein YcfJ
MIKKSSILILAVGTALVTGCESNTGTGVLLGGVSGAAIGGIAGGGTGALIGGAAGVIAGGLIGSYLDNQEQKRLKEQSSQTYGRVDKGDHISVNDVINMSKADIPDDKIIQYIKDSKTRFNLNSYQIDKLREAGVSERVVNYMMYNT